MHITLSISNSEIEGDEGDILSLDVFPDMTVDTLRTTIQAETRIETSSQHLYHNGQLITDHSKTLQELGIADNDMLALHVRSIRGNITGGSGPGGQPTGAARGGAQPPAPDVESLRLQLLGDERSRNVVAQRQPELAAAINDPQRFAQLLNSSRDADQREREERQREIQRLNADPFDVEAQARIAELIRQERVMENLQNAVEYNPEVFGRVHLLFIDVEVNGYKMKALVDTGAQATIMSPQVAEACGIMRLVDTRFAGMAKGVGTAAILGRVHAAQIKIGPLFLMCSFTIMQGKHVDLLLGLDMLKRFQAYIDLPKDKLIIQGVEVPFLSERDIPKDVEEALDDEPKISGPGGTTIGQRTGVVSPPSGSGSGSAPAVPSGSTPTPGPGPAPGPASGQGRPAGSQTAPPPQPPRPQFPDADIGALMNLGATRERAVRALVQTGGNVEYAAALIFEEE